MAMISLLNSSISSFKAGSSTSAALSTAEEFFRISLFKYFCSASVKLFCSLWALMTLCFKSLVNFLFFSRFLLMALFFLAFSALLAFSTASLDNLALETSLWKDSVADFFPREVGRAVEPGSMLSKSLLTVAFVLSLEDSEEKAIDGFYNLPEAILRDEEGARVFGQISGPCYF